MKFLASILFFILSTIAGLHVYWAMGGLWPASSVIELVQTVIGEPEWSQMPPVLITLAVAALIFIAGLVALRAGEVFTFGYRWIASLGVCVLALVFLARGVAGYWFAYQGVVQTEPFATYNLHFYSPLCLAIGAAFVVLFFKARQTERTSS